MVLKGLAFGAAVATVAIAIFAALTFQPAPAQVQTAPAANVVILPNGMAAPQLQPVQQSAPVIVEAETNLVSAVLPAVQSAGAAALAEKAALSASGNADIVTSPALTGCGGK